MNVLGTATVVVFWICAGLVCYAYAGYPVLAWILARVFGRRRWPPEISEDDLPLVSLLIAAYNEEAVIEDRVRNALAMDYPPEKLEIVIASDGSSDATPGIVRRYAHRGVRLLDYAHRQGKAGVLNASFPELKGEIALLSDANVRFEPDAVRKIVRWFRDLAVGVVCGRVALTDPPQCRNVSSLYWKYDSYLKQCESRLGALVAVNGAIYAIRKSLYVPVPPDTIVDDFVLPLQAKLRSRCQIVYDCEAICWEESPPDVGSEFQRRSRIGAGGFQSIGLLWPLLYPRHGWIGFTFLSHKVLRWLCPFFLIGMLLSNLALWQHPFFRYTLFAQLGFLLLSLLVALLPARLRAVKPLRLTTMFTTMNAALLVGFWRWLRGGQKAAWRRTPRGGGVGRVPQESSAE